jgi:antitoxin YefM
METINITTARQRLYQLVKSTNETHLPIQITGKNGDAVLLSVEDWKAIEETLYLNSVPGLANAILTGDKESLDEMVDADTLEW